MPPSTAGWRPAATCLCNFCRILLSHDDILMKMTTSDLNLLQQYTQKHSEEAFATLVQRHVNLVYSAALRQTRSPQLAEEVSQSVFTDLAQCASRLAQNTVLTAWLYQVTRRTAIDIIRREARRQLREQIAAEMNSMNAATAADWTPIEPLLDEAMEALEENDRAAILLRYFENKSLRDVGEALGTSDDTAQKRVSRAVERLREFFAKRGIAIGGTGLIIVISANAVQAAPAGLAATLVTATFAGTTLTTISATTTKAIAMTMTQKIVVGVAFAACVGMPLAIQHRAQSQLRIENELLRTELNEHAQLAEENQRLSNALAQVTRTNPQSLPTAQFDELLRLRGEVGRLRAEARESAALKTNAKSASVRPVDTLLAQLQKMPEKSIPELQLLDEKKWAEDATRGKLDTPDGVRETLANLRRAAKIRFAYDLSSALNNYVQASNGQLPGNVADLKPYFKNPPDEQPVDDTVFQRYELLHSGSVNDAPPGEPLIAEKTPVDDEYDTQFKIWANGYSLVGTGKWSSQPAVTNVWNPAAGTAR